MTTFVTLVLAILAASIISTSSSESTPRSCPAGWRDAHSADHLGCILLVKEQLSWDEAAARCWNNQNSHLVSLTTEHQRTYLGQIIYLEDLHHHYWWVGATDRNTEGRWRWSYSCEEVGGLGWRQSEPAGGILENCAVQSGKDYQWEDCDCNADMFGDLPIYAICQLN
eukprot:GFUD01132289.1.p1 GENE.GFUD01132289.1~~GFUD01132289.1.p1  ORF type:complete len:168 (+),score=32.40 GFUD01132289.1:32-535(+)